MLLENVGYRHLQNAWASKFTGPVKFDGLSFVWFPEWDGGAEAMLEHAVANLPDSDIQITGNTARFALRATPPQNFFMQNWWVAMVNDGTGWKWDLSRTLHVRATLTFARKKLPTTSDQEVKFALEQKQGNGTILENCAQAIERGEITSANAARNRIEKQIADLNKRDGLVGASYNFIPAMPVSSELVP
jgi:hypothetical protein